MRPSPQAIAHLESALAGRHTSRSDQWHVTLAFLGDVSRAESLSQGLRSAAAAVPPFTLHLEGGGAFRGARVVWAGLGGDLQPLAELAGRVQQACRESGIPLDQRPFRPHLTVGKLGHLDPHVLRDYSGPSWRVSQIELVRSVLGRTAVHTVVETFPLYQA